MRDVKWYWRCGRTQKTLCLRMWAPWSWWGLWRNFRGWLTGRDYYEARRPVRVDARTLIGHSGRCYCPDGSTSEVRLSVFGIGFWLWLNRYWGVAPCWCDKVMWAYYPDGNQDDIENYGRERFEAEMCAAGVVPERVAE